MDSSERLSKVFYADGNTPDDHWHIRDNFSRDSLPIQHYLTKEKSKVLFDLTLPYFRTISLEKLVEILVDETDLLSPFRKSLKDIVLKFVEVEGDLEEIKQDIIRPQLDMINRKFRNYKNIHKWGVRGSVGLITVSLLKVEVPLENIADFIASIITGAGLSGIILSDRLYQSKVNELRDNPYFLLWRIQRQPRL